MPTQRPAASSACHARPHATSSSIDANGGGGSRWARRATRGPRRRRPARRSVKVRSTAWSTSRSAGVQWPVMGCETNTRVDFSPILETSSSRPSRRPLRARPGRPTRAARGRTSASTPLLAGTTPVEDEIADRSPAASPRCGVEPGSTVSWQLANSWPAVVAVPGLLAARRGGRADPPPRRRRRRRRHARPAEPGGLRRPTNRAADRPAGRSPRPEIDPASVAVALGTSGSTGTPEGRAAHPPGPAAQGPVMAAVHDLGPDDAILMPAPMAHISGLLNGVLLAVVGHAGRAHGPVGPGRGARDHRARAGSRS